MKIFCFHRFQSKLKTQIENNGNAVALLVILNNFIPLPFYSPNYQTLSLLTRCSHICSSVLLIFFESFCWLPHCYLSFYGFSLSYDSSPSSSSSFALFVTVVRSLSLSFRFGLDLSSLKAFEPSLACDP